MDEKELYKEIGSMKAKIESLEKNYNDLKKDIDTKLDNISKKLEEILMKENQFKGGYKVYIILGSIIIFGSTLLNNIVKFIN